MKNIAVFAIAAIAFLSTLESTEAQVLRRFRNNVREAFNPQVTPPQQSRLSNQQQFQYVNPQAANQGQVPRQRQVTTVVQQLTPYQRLTPEQRRATTRQQASNAPRLIAPTPLRNPAVGAPNSTTIRVVTYYDPRTGRTFERRFLVPANPPNQNSRPAPGQVVTGEKSIFNQPQKANALKPNRVKSTAPSLVPPIEFSPQVAQQPRYVSPDLLPALSGPTSSAPTVAADQIVDFVEDFETSPEVATVSAEIDVVSPLEAASTGIPDLSGLTIAPAVDKSIEQDGQDLFFDDAGDETTDGEINYSVLEEFEEE